MHQMLGSIAMESLEFDCLLVPTTLTESCFCDDTHAGREFTVLQVATLKPIIGPHHLGKL
jgi:hypothetical protein